MDVEEEISPDHGIRQLSIVRLILKPVTKHCSKKYTFL